jgi:serine phosphatase RsbU (regulator of sigma subunit)
MALALAYILGPLVAAAWIRVRPPQKFGRVVLLWIAGIVLARVLPGVAQTIVDRSGSAGPLPVLAGLGEWLGGVFLLRALWYLATVDRPRGRAYPYMLTGVTLAFLLPVLAPTAASAFLPLAVPMLWSFRWRKKLGAGALALASVVALASFLLGMLKFSAGQGSPTGASGGFGAFVSQASLAAALYALAALPAAATRIHLSIRRVGPRLVGSHLLAALIPFALGVAFLLVAGGFFLATYRGSLAVRLLIQQSERAQERLATGAAGDPGGRLEPFGEGPRRQFTLIREGNSPTRALGDLGSTGLTFSPDSLLAQDESSTECPLLWDGRALFLRARWDGTRSDAHGARTPVRTEALAEVDSVWMAQLSSILGVPVRISPGVTVGRSSRGVTIGIGDGESRAVDSTRTADDHVTRPADGEEETPPRGTEGAIGPKDGPGFRLPGGATVRCLRASPTGWSHRTIPVAASASFAENLSFFWSVPRDNPIAFVVLMALAVIAFLFLSAIGVATGMVLEMGRSVTRAVRALTDGTRALREGKLDHRIAVEGRDELWEVAASFNDMADNLEETRVRELAAQRMEEDLRLARVIQDRLLPSGPPALDRLELAGMSLPAREVGGDYYDYLLLDDGRLGLAVADVSGKGTPAALLMSAFRAALRSQDLGAIGPGEAMARINRFIHESVDPGKFITAYLALIDPASGVIRYANAGHDAPLVVGSDGSVTELTGGGLILGMLPQIVYDEAAAVLDRGALLAIFTDGVTEAQDPAGEFYGTPRLAEVLQRHRARPCADILHCLTEEIAGFAGEGPQSDDITVILARRT